MHVFNPFMLLCTSFSCYILWTLHLSNRYLDRLADSLQQKLKVSEKLVASIKTMADKRQAASTEQQDLEPNLEVVRMKTKELQVQVLSFDSLITFALPDNESFIVTASEKLVKFAQISFKHSRMRRNDTKQCMSLYSLNYPHIDRF